ncbi:MAG: hypothetical protein H7Y31_04735 [Chitinophagaceae bacterium]|nr:hypothetical protein [Chitinophagaceae bacterium]
MKIAFTICTNNYLSMARAAAESFKRHNPDYFFIIGIIDPPDPALAKWYEGYRMLFCSELQITDLHEMAQRYTIVELSCALKSFFTKHIIQEHPLASEVLYIDSDLYFYSDVTAVSNLHQEHDIILTPHLIRPMTFDGKQPDEIAYLATGTYNGGFFSLKVSDNSKRFVNWWCERMREYCYYNLEKGLFVDQKWLNLVPVFFDRVYIHKDPGYNICYWNLHERNVECIDGRYLVNGSSPLVFYHFSSINLKEGILFFKQQDRFTDLDLPVIRQLFIDYRAAVFAEGFEETNKSKSYFSSVFQQYTTSTLKKTLKGRIKLWVKNNVKPATKERLKRRLKGIIGS